MKNLHSTMMSVNSDISDKLDNIEAVKGAASAGTQG